jgi:hypothetical protein
VNKGHCKTEATRLEQNVVKKKISETFLTYGSIMAKSEKMELK